MAQPPPTFPKPGQGAYSGQFSKLRPTKFTPKDHSGDTVSDTRAQWERTARHKPAEKGTQEMRKSAIGETPNKVQNMIDKLSPQAGGQSAACWSAQTAPAKPWGSPPRGDSRGLSVGSDSKAAGHSSLSPGSQPRSTGKPVSGDSKSPPATSPRGRAPTPLRQPG